ncbi:MAG TPA: hypothetical protein VGH23_16295 [Rhizomicrobium sp.]|jgi:hypothetical protein
MSRLPQILGRVTLDEAQGRLLAESVVITISAGQFRQHITKRARLGDVIWVQEPFYAYALTGMFRVPPVMPGVVAGPRFEAKTPDKFKMYRHNRRYHTDASRLPRERSRCTLEIASFDAASLNCICHMQNIDDFMAARRAAA